MKGVQKLSFLLSWKVNLNTNQTDNSNINFKKWICGAKDTHKTSLSTSSAKKNNKLRSATASDQQDNTLNKQSKAKLQLSSTVALGRAVLAFSIF